METAFTGIQELLTSPNPLSPANGDAYTTYQKNRNKYNQRIRDQARKCTPDT